MDRKSGAASRNIYLPCVFPYGPLNQFCLHTARKPLEKIGKPYFPYGPVSCTVAAMETKCSAQTEDESSVYTCTQAKGHAGLHMHVGPDAVVYLSWPQESEGLIAVEFTVQELAELYGILSGNHDIPAVYLNKVGKALKEAL